MCSLGSVLHLLLLLGLLLLKASPSFSGLFSLVPKQLKLVSYGVTVSRRPTRVQVSYAVLPENIPTTLPLMKLPEGKI